MQQQRVGLILGVMAWCMQLVVFVQPFLPGHSVPGFGICQTIVDALRSSPSLTATSSHTQSQPAHRPATPALATHQQHQSPPEQPGIQPAHMLMASNHAMPHTAGEPMIPAHPVDHHFSHLACGFCMLYGHAIPPPGPQPLWSLAALTVYVTLARFYYFAVPALTPDYIKPQSRAPPADYMA